MEHTAIRPNGEWRLWLNAAVAQELRANGEFQLALLLARMIDGLRFGIAAAWLSRNQTHAMADQQRFSTIFHLAAVLNEIEDWRKRHGPEIAAFGPLGAAFSAMDAVVVEPNLRAAMGRLRNKIVSHFDSEPFEKVLRTFPSEGFAFAEGRGNSLLSDSNDLANAVVALFTLEIQADFASMQERTLALLDAVIARANAFAAAGRDALHLHLLSRGAVFLEPEPPAPAV